MVSLSTIRRHSGAGQRGEDIMGLLDEATDLAEKAIGDELGSALGLTDGK